MCTSGLGKERSRKQAIKLTQKLNLDDLMRAEIDRSGFSLILQKQVLLQDQKQKLLPDSEAPV